MSQKSRKPSQSVTPLSLPYVEQTLLKTGTVTPTTILPIQKDDPAAMSFDDYQAQWLESVRDGNPSPLELGRRFGSQLFTQWLEIEATSDDLFYCDGTKDGGIDIAYRLLANRQLTDEDSSAQGDIWYLVQSKYGSAFRGANTLLTEGIKIIDTLIGKRKLLSSLSEEIVTLLRHFREKASEWDRIILVFATEVDLSPDEKQALHNIRTIGREQIGLLFDIETISIRTIYQRVQNKPGDPSTETKVPLTATLTLSGEDLYVGTVPLLFSVN